MTDDEKIAAVACDDRFLGIKRHENGYEHEGADEPLRPFVAVLIEVDGEDLAVSEETARAAYLKAFDVLDEER